MAAHTDKRSVATDALETLGTIIGESERRDAIHLAVEPVVAAHDLSPGQHVGLYPDGRAGVFDLNKRSSARVADRKIKKVGIVDPFLTETVREGQRFWLVVYPRQVTSLRHVWTHPDFPAESGVNEPTVPAPIDDERKRASEAWLRDFIASHDCPDYEVVMAAATGQHHLNFGDGGYLCSTNDGEFLHFGGHDAHGEIPPEFWHHVEIVSGKKIPDSDRAEYFSCSC